MAKNREDLNLVPEPAKEGGREIIGHSYEGQFSAIQHGIGSFLNAKAEANTETIGQFLDTVLQNFQALEIGMRSEDRFDDAVWFLQRIVSKMVGTEASARALSILVENISRIETLIDAPRFADKRKGLFVCHDLLKFGNASQRKLGADLLIKNFDVIMRTVKMRGLESVAEYGSLELLTFFLRIGDFEKERDAKAMILEVAQNPGSEFWDVATVLSDMLSSGDGREKFFAEYVVQKVLEKHGIPMMASKWKRESGESFSETVRINLQGIFSLEKEAPGISHFLYQHFNISNFSEQKGRELMMQKYAGFKYAEDPRFYQPWEEEEARLKKYGLDFNDLKTAWEDGNPRILFWAIESNMKTITELEQKRPGITRVLGKEFGIKYFARYTDALLIAQYDERNLADRPYGIILYPRHDWNGAFQMDTRLLAMLYLKLKDKMRMRIIECESKYEIARALIALHKKYGEHHKISFALMGGHGAEKDIQFGERHDPRGHLALTDLTGPGAQRIKKFFEPEPTIILNACSTGRRGGIAQGLSKIMGAQVIGPEVPTYIDSIEPTFDGNKVHFSVQYGKEKIERSYVEGREIETNQKPAEASSQANI